VSRTKSPMLKLTYHKSNRADICTIESSMDNPNWIPFDRKRLVVL